MAIHGKKKSQVQTAGASPGVFHKSLMAVGGRGPLHKAPTLQGCSNYVSTSAEHFLTFLSDKSANFTYQVSSWIIPLK